jgi:hypothetical protein
VAKSGQGRLHGIAPDLHILALFFTQRWNPASAIHRLGFWLINDNFRECLTATKPLKI